LYDYGILREVTNYVPYFNTYTNNINFCILLALCTQHKVLRRPRPASISSSLFMGTTLVSGASDGGIHIVDTSSGVNPRPIVEYAAHQTQINCLTAHEGTIYSGGMLKIKVVATSNHRFYTLHVIMDAVLISRFFSECLFLNDQLFIFFLYPLRNYITPHQL